MYLLYIKEQNVFTRPYMQRIEELVIPESLSINAWYHAFLNISGVDLCEKKKIWNKR